MKILAGFASACLVAIAMMVSAPAEAKCYGDTAGEVCGVVVGYIDDSGHFQAVDSSHPMPGGGSSGGVVTYTTTDKGATITSGGTAQAAIALNASRKIWCIQNDPAATEVLNVRLNGTASANTGTKLLAGQQACNAPGGTDTSAVSVFAATTGHRFFGFEGQ
jgi:hypothetical protein